MNLRVSSHTHIILMQSRLVLSFTVSLRQGALPEDGGVQSYVSWLHCFQTRPFLAPKAKEYSAKIALFIVNRNECNLLETKLLHVQMETCVPNASTQLDMLSHFAYTHTIWEHWLRTAWPHHREQKQGHMSVWWSFWFPRRHKGCLASCPRGKWCVCMCVYQGELQGEMLMCWVFF